MKRFLLLITLVFNLFFVRAQSTLGGIGMNTVLSTFDADYQRVLYANISRGVSLPSITCQIAQNQLMIDIKAAIGISSFQTSTTDFDQIKVMLHDGPADFSDVNWANPATKKTIQQYQVPYTPLVGFSNPLVSTGLGGSESLNMGRLGPNFTLNSGEFITYYTDMVAGSYNDGGFLSGAPTNTCFNVTRTATTCAVGINGGSTLTTLSGFDLNNGLYFYGRTNSTTVFARKGSGSRVTGSQSSTSLWPYDYYVLAVNTSASSVPNGGSGGGDKKVGFWTSGRLLTTTEETSINTAWNNYLTFISAISAPQTVGTVYNVSSFPNLNDFTQNGCTASVVSNQINLTGGSNTFTQTLDLTSISGTSIGATKLSKWSQTIKFIVPTLTGTNWIGVGIRSSNANGNFYDLILRMDFTSGSTGKMKAYSGPSHTLIRTTSSALSITAGDVVSMTVNLNGGYITYSCYNTTTDPTAAAQIKDAVVLYNISGGFIDNTGHFALFDGGGSVNTNKVTSWTISSNEYKGVGIAFMGDSKTQTYQATGQSQPLSSKTSYTYLLERKIGPIINLGGSSDRTADYLTRTYEIINWIQPKTIVIVGVCNDIRAGVPDATWQANVLSLISTFQAAGIRVIFWTGFKEAYPIGGTVDQTGVSTWAAANLTGVCDVWDSVATTYTLNDNVHPDTNGHNAIYRDALSYGKLRD